MVYYLDCSVSRPREEVFEYSPYTSADHVLNGLLAVVESFLGHIATPLGRRGVGGCKMPRVTLLGASCILWTFPQNSDAHKLTLLHEQAVRCYYNDQVNELLAATKCMSLGAYDVHACFSSKLVW